jgi:hypothetical protein
LQYARIAADAGELVQQLIGLKAVPLGEVVGKFTRLRQVGDAWAGGGCSAGRVE